MDIVMIDYGMGNLKNVQKAFLAIGQEVVISSELEVIAQADALILPGVGAFKQAMETLCATGMSECIKTHVRQNKPLLGICLGMQLLFEKSYEHGECEGLGLLPGEVVYFDGKDEALKIPHMGWNTLEITQRMPLFEDVSQESYAYFVHSYHVKTEADVVSAWTTYGARVPVAVQQGCIYGMQYHPEKSSDAGLKMLENFAKLCGRN